MTLNVRFAQSWLAKAVHSVGRGLAGAGLLAATGTFTAGCLDRPIAPATPNTTNIYVGAIRQTGVDKIDLLFMIDNSISMADKQEILGQAVPVLLDRLVNPVCVRADGSPAGARVNGECPMGSAPEFKAVENIHIGVITSSLGHHGSKDVCSDASGGRTPDDLAQLLPSVRPTLNLAQWNNQGFLVWDPRTGQNVDNPHMPPGWGAPGGPGDGPALVEAFAAQIAGTGELGCGYEQQLEAWYRFLVDPEPVASMDNNTETSVRGPVNPTVLAQREAFLRRDSLLAIIMLTDENDCSIIDENGYQGWLVGYKGGPTVNSWRMPRATNTCATDPNSPCCRPCIGDAPASCPADEANGCTTDTLTITEDSMNQRCYNQIQRFGINLLYPTWRYVEALTSPMIDPRLTGKSDVLNPLFAPGPNGEPGRERGLVFLAGLVGVPWQDIATDGNVAVAEGKPQPPNSLQDGRALVYLTADQLRAKDRWPMILGEPNGTAASPTPILPSDPLMIESIDPRMAGATHPLAGQIQGNTAIVPPGGTQSNVINGREQAVDPDSRDDLQFACIFDLQEPVPCTTENAAGCDCNGDEYVKNSPLCQYGTPEMNGTQIKAKAYPGLRELQVLRDIGSNAIVASICPKNVTAQGGNPVTDPYYGYNPAVAAIVDRLKEALTAKCLPRPLAPDFTVPPEDPEYGKVPCAVVEVRPKTGTECAPCDPNDDGDPSTPSSNGRVTLAGEKIKVIPAVKEYMRNQGQCGRSGTPSCDSYCMCEIQQFVGEQLDTCRTSNTSPGLNGYCYVDPATTEQAAAADGEITPDEQALIDGESELVANCKETERRILHFMGENLPAKDGLAVIACVGAAVSSVNP